jgi:opacity protein-like surface antigen
MISKRYALLALTAALSMNVMANLHADSYDDPQNDQQTQTSDEDKHMFNGFFLGVAGGAATNLAQSSLSTSASYVRSGTITDVLTDYAKADVYQIAPWGEIFGGWGIQPASWLYLGGRLAVSFSSFHPDLKSSASQTEAAGAAYSASLSDKVKTKMQPVEFTFDFKPGFVFCQKTMLSVLLGGAYNKEQLRGSSDFTFTDTAVVPSVSYPNNFSVNHKKTSVGFRWGLGLEQLLTSYLSLQANYTYTYYWTLKDSNSSTVTTPFGSVVNGHQANMKTDASKEVVSLGLAFYF